MGECCILGKGLEKTWVRIGMGGMWLPCALLSGEGGGGGLDCDLSVCLARNLVVFLGGEGCSSDKE